MLNKILIGLVVLVLIGGGAYYFMNKDSGSNQTASNQTPPPPPAAQPIPPPPPPPATPEKAIAKFETTSGNFEITLDGKAAPKTVANFTKLANEGYYNGIKFHRIVAGFMIQGGDPLSKDDDPVNDGTGGPGYTVPAEIGLKHKEGAISMARTPDQYNPTRASSGSQFFIVLEESANNHSALDGAYSAFGYVTKGMDVIKKIGATPVELNPNTGESSLPLKAVVINKIIIEEVK